MFPSNVLPLHIFESRYKEMLEDALRGDQLVAMATLMPGFEHDYYSRPPRVPRDLHRAHDRAPTDSSGHLQLDARGIGAGENRARNRACAIVSTRQGHCDRQPY